VAKTLVLIRHAKAASPDGAADHDRPLTDRGRQDAAAAGRWLRSREISPHVAIVSDARRTRDTYELLSVGLATPPGAVMVTDQAYYADAEQLLALIRGLSPDYVSAMVVAHNPGIGTLAHTLDDGASTSPDAAKMRVGFPTTSVAVFTLAVSVGQARP
jgi:phosphohistidine phosphatase